MNRGLQRSPNWVCQQVNKISHSNRGFRSQRRYCPVGSMLRYRAKFVYQPAQG